MKTLTRKSMRPVCVAMLATLALSACSSVGSLTAEQQAMKPACVAGDMSVCAEIGHQVAATRG